MNITELKIWDKLSLMGYASHPMYTYTILSLERIFDKYILCEKSHWLGTIAISIDSIKSII